MGSRASSAASYIPAVRWPSVILASSVAVAHAAPTALAGGLVVTSGSPRSVGRAGTGTIGDDGGGALLVNPAAMARRAGARAQLGFLFADDEIAWQGSKLSAGEDPQPPPVVRNQSASGMAPFGAAIGSVGPWVIGLGAMTSGLSERTLRRPSDLPPSSLDNKFEFRYAGIEGAMRRDTVAFGVARRIGDTLAIGASLSATRVQLIETRRMWAGFGGRDRIGAPQQDIEVSFDAEDWFVPGAMAGVLLAPGDGPLELGASIGWTQTVRVDADVAASGTPRGPAISKSRASARLHLRQPVALRAGARYLGERFVLELGGDLWIAPEQARAPRWLVRDVSVLDPSGVEVDLIYVPSRISMRTHGAVRGAVDAELIGGFLWATAGYAFSVGAVSADRQSPTFGDLGGHTLALGLEGTAGGFTFTIGWSRTWSVAFRSSSRLELDNPFHAGTAEVPGGVYDGSIDQIGILIDAELDAP